MLFQAGFCVRIRLFCGDSAAQQDAQLQPSELKKIAGTGAAEAIGVETNPSTYSDTASGLQEPARASVAVPSCTSTSLIVW